RRLPRRRARAGRPRGGAGRRQRAGEPEPGAVEGLDEPRAARVVGQGLAQLLEARGEGRVAHRHAPPHRLEQLLLGEQSPGAAGEGPGDRDRLGGQPDLLPAPAEASAAGVELEATEANRLILRHVGRSPPPGEIPELSHDFHPGTAFTHGIAGAPWQPARGGAGDASWEESEPVVDGKGATAMSTEKCLSIALLAVVAALLAAPMARADVVTDWNVKAGELVVAARLGPPPAYRVMALTHTAAYDAATPVTRPSPATPLKLSPRPPAPP